MKFNDNEFLYTSYKFQKSSSLLAYHNLFTTFVQQPATKSPLHPFIGNWSEYNMWHPYIGQTETEFGMSLIVSSSNYSTETQRIKHHIFCTDRVPILMSIRFGSLNWCSRSSISMKTKQNKHRLSKFCQTKKLPLLEDQGQTNHLIILPYTRSC